MTVKTIISLFITLLMTSFIILLIPELGFGQVPPPPLDPSQAPIDGGLALLAAAGGAYGLNKLKNKKA